MLDATSVPPQPAAAAVAARPWEAFYPAGVEWAMPIPSEPLHAVFERSVARFGERPCMDFLGRRFSYRETGRLVERAAAGFQALGVGPGVQVGLCLPNCPYYVIAYYGVLKAGGTVVNYNPLYVERELIHQIEDSETSIMVTLDVKQIYPKIATMLKQSSLKKVVVCRMADCLPAVKSMLFRTLKRAEVADVADDDRHVQWSRLIDNDGKVKPVEIDPKTAVAVLQYTGGTTGVPKGAALTHANLVANQTQVTTWFIGARPGEERMLAILPFFHVFAMTVVLNVGIAVGAEIIMLPRFEAEQVLKTIGDKRPTLLPGVPTMYKAILSAPQAAKTPLNSIRLCISGGAPLPLELKRQFESATGCVLVEGYGLSECAPVATANPVIGINKEGSIGVPVPGVTVEIRDLTDFSRVLGVGEKGEVAVRGPNVMLGYWRRPTETADTIVDGALRTGDVGMIDAEGYVFLLDRLKDLIICGGYNVYPRAVEEAIYLHPEVEAVTVIGIPDDYRGQTPKAFVQRRGGSTLTAEQLLAFLADKLSRIELPKLIEFRDELPKTAVGKLSKKELIAEESAKRAGSA